jgi:hypothetical protein
MFLNVKSLLSSYHLSTNVLVTEGKNISDNNNGTILFAMVIPALLRVLESFLLTTAATATITTTLLVRMRTSSTCHSFGDHC